MNSYLAPQQSVKIRLRFRFGFERDLSLWGLGLYVVDMRLRWGSRGL